MYSCFNQYVLRTPLLPLKEYFDLTKDTAITDTELKAKFDSPLIKEAIYLASPDLYIEIQKWVENKITDKKKIKKIKKSFLKYLSRITSRATPFGLFSGVSSGQFNRYTSVVISNDIFRKTRLDMNITGLLTQKLEEDPEVKNKLKFYPNNSLYEFNDNLRFIESTYKKKHLFHKLIEIENSKYIEAIIANSRNGLEIKELAKTIIDSEISLDDAMDFVNSLVDSQILTSELQQSVSGQESLEYLIKILHNRIRDKIIVEKLNRIRSMLHELDTAGVNSISKYEEIISTLLSMGINFDRKHVFQTDLTMGYIKNNLSYDIKKEIERAFFILNKISSKKKYPPLDQFREKFEERYEQQEIPLTTALDEQVGIGFPVNSAQRDSNPLLENLVFPASQEDSENSVEWSKFHSIIFQKISTLNNSKDLTIELSDQDLDGLSTNFKDLPETMSTITKIVELDGKRKIVIGAISGPGGANLLGRFCHSNDEIMELVNKIIDFEERSNKEKILAEIVHLPKDRIGNILMRPTLRRYEIPYLARSNKEFKDQININDITVSVRNKRIVLRSIKKNKEIIPKLSSAHNFSSSTIPIYRFLCALQYNNKIPSMFFDWGYLESELDFFPRVIYRDLILSLAKWKLNYSKLKKFESFCYDKEVKEKFCEWRQSNNIPEKVYVIEGDNKLLINFNNELSSDLLFGILKKRKQVFIEEFLFEGNKTTRNPVGEEYANEFVFSFHKSQNN